MVLGAALIRPLVVKAKWHPRNEKVVFFVKRLMMAQQGSVIRLGFKASGLQNPPLLHMPGRRNRKRYGQVWGYRY